MAWTTETKPLPDFLLIGAMKSGTTSLHHLMASHPDIFMPEGEVFFFTLDDIEQKPDSFIQAGDDWTFHDLDRDFEKYLTWYQEHFAPAAPGQMLGEDSTTYLPSRKAPARIAKLVPDAKLIALLRDPVQRAYSHYWHTVQNGLAIFDFETTLERCPGRIFSRSMYRESVERYLEYFSKDQMKFIIFEEFVSNTQEVLDEVFDFLGLDSTISVHEHQSHQNASKAPLLPGLKRRVNHFFRRRLDQPTAGALLKNQPNSPSWWQSQCERGAKGLAAALLRNRATAKAERMLSRSEYPPMNPETEEFLEKLFWKENRGLSELIGQDVSEYWSYFDHQ